MNNVDRFVWAEDLSRPLKRIEERHELNSYLCSGLPHCSPVSGTVCDMVKLARALEAIANPREPNNLGEPLSRLLLAQEIARRALEEAAGE